MEDLEEKKMEIDALTEMLVEKETIVDEWEGKNTLRARAVQQASSSLRGATQELLEYAATFQTKLGGSWHRIQSWHSIQSWHLCMCVEPLCRHAGVTGAGVRSGRRVRNPGTLFPN